MTNTPTFSVCFYRVAILALTAFFFVPALAGAGKTAVVWVGAGATCDNDNLPTAVAAASSGTIIFLANDQTYQDLALQIVGKDLELRGGYDNCWDVEPTGMTQLRGVPDQPGYVVSFIGGLDSEGDAYRLQLNNLEIRGGENDSGGGGGILLSDAFRASLVNVDILGHHAVNGAGLKLEGAGGGGGADLSLSNVNIGPALNVAMMRNEASGQGGGIWCEKASILAGHTNIRHNRASGNGGGVWMNQCQIHWYGSGGINRVTHNRSTSDGGGFYMTDSAITMADPGSMSVGSRGHPEEPPGPNAVIIADNDAGNDGGGIFASASTITLIDSPVIGNEAEFGSGGAMYLLSESEVSMIGRRPFDSGCLASEPVCTLLSGNAAEFTAAVVVATNSSLTISRGWIENNTSIDGNSIITVSGSQSNLNVLDSLIAGNESLSRLLSVSAQAQARIIGNTIVNNVFPSFVFYLFDNTAVSLRNSIVWQPGISLVGGDGDLTADCSNAHENSADPALETHDPGFADPAGGNYQLRADSANIDRCAAPIAQTPHLDLLGRARPQYVSGDAGDPDLAYDRGAFEFFAGLFRDRFELLP